MDFGLSDEQREFQALCRRFAAEVIRPVAAKHDAEESTPWEVIKAAREWGLNGIEHLQRMGRRPRRPVRRHLRRGAPLGLRRHRPRDLGLGARRGRARLLRARPSRSPAGCPSASASGDEIKLGAYAVTEPQAGSDVKSLRTTAKRDGDEWVLNGTKVFITNGGIADVHVVVATGRPGARPPRPGLVRDPEGHARPRAGQEGVQARHPRLADRRGDPRGLPRSRSRTCSAGWRSSSASSSAPAPGESSGRASDALATFELTRPLVGASALGIAQAAYEWTLDYLDDGASGDPIAECLDESSTAGQPPLERQAIQQVLADVATEIEAARLLVQRASWMGRNGIPMTGGQGSMSKLKAGDVAMWATRTVHGPGRPVRADDGLPAREVVPRREDLPALRGHGRDPAAGHLAHAGRRVPRAPARGGAAIAAEATEPALGGSVAATSS